MQAVCRDHSQDTAGERKKPPEVGGFPQYCGFHLALTGFEPALRLVDDVDTALAAHNAAVAMAVLERTKRVLDLHGVSPLNRGARAPFGLRVP